MSLDPSTRHVLQRVADGDADALGPLFERHRSALERMVRLRLDPHLRARLEPADVVQEAFLVAVGRTAEYLQRREAMPFALWLRLVTGEKLAELHRRHLGAARRDARREVAPRAIPGADTEAVSHHLMASATGPLTAVDRDDVRSRVATALEEMESIDAEVLVLRHFEGLSNLECAQELDITPGSASKRYARALTRLARTLKRAGGQLPPPTA